MRPAATVTEWSFLEREPQLRALTGWFAAAAAGSGCVTLLTGEAGIGKTSLLRNFAAGREAIFLAALEELERCGPPTLVIFEDVRSADEATLDLLKFLGRRIYRAPAMLIATFRDDEVGARHPLRFVIGDLPRASVHRLPLDTLSETAVAELARRAGRSFRDVYDATGGNPFFVTEVLATTQSGVPASVRDAVLARASRLTPAAREWQVSRDEVRK